VTSSVAILTVLVTNPVIIAQWNFNSVPPDGSTATGSTTPAIGSGTAALVGGTTATFASGDAALDSAASDNTGWNLTGFPASGGNKTAGAQFAVSTAGKQNISLAFSLRSSNTGGKYFRPQYSTNGGTSFLDFPTAIILPTATTFYAFTNDLSALPGVTNNASFVFRIVSEFESTATGAGSAGYVAANSGSTYAGSTGTTRFDMVTVSGVPIVTNIPPIAPSFGVPMLSSGQLQFTVSGTVGASYIVQMTTNLGGGWVPVLTNTAPFLLADTNLGVADQKFYRVLAAPQQ
jgi:hypothetical protein